MKLTLGVFVLYCSVLIDTSSADNDDETPSNRTFPAKFKFGAATAAYQVEGAWNEDGKGENIWDRLVHTNATAIKEKDNGDIACDSYHKYKEDVALLKYLGLNHYRFSISWSRIFPYGFSFKVNEAGVNYYNNLIDELLENGIEPLITLYHWDLPQPLQDVGGWPSEVLIDPFAEYARFVFATYGDRVKSWLTFNEIKQVCQLGYGSGVTAPLIQSSGIGEYMCVHTVLKAHAKAYHIYDDEFRSTQNGRVGIVIDTDWWEPATNSSEDASAAEIKRQFVFGWHANPIFNGNYPKIMIERIGNRSKAEGFKQSRLPVFTDEEIDYINGTYDFLGLNTYSTSLVKAIDEPEIGTPSWEKDTGVYAYHPDDWTPSASSWLWVVPWGTRKLLNWIKETYNNPEIIITENGYSDNGTLHDPNRIHYLKMYLSNILEAILEDGVNVTGYTVWSLLDNLEWLSGFTEKLGIVQVDFNSPNRTRTIKDSAEYYKKVVETHCLVDSCVD